MDKPTVLVVDDEPLIATMVEACFVDAGFDVVCVLDAREAADQIEDLGDRLSVLVTDIRLGTGRSGWEVATHARTLRPFLPVVYMTGDSAADWSAFGVPKSVLVQKPFVGAQVLAAAMALMNSDDSDGSAPA